jgi:hypothetical protein
VVSTKGNRIEGLRLGNVEAKVVLDDEPLCSCGTQRQLSEFYKKQSEDTRRRFSWRFQTPEGAAEIQPHGHYHRCSLVREIKLSGPEDELKLISVDGYTIIWKGFGRIILAEVLVKAQERQLTLLRLAMGSDAEGSGSVGDGRSNGMVGS